MTLAEDFDLEQVWKEYFTFKSWLCRFPVQFLVNWKSALN
jgi:hypothetical protein